MKTEKDFVDGKIEAFAQVRDLIDRFCFSSDKEDNILIKRLFLSKIPNIQSPLDSDVAESQRGRKRTEGESPSGNGKPTEHPGKEPTSGSAGSRQVKDAPLGILTSEEKENLMILYSRLELVNKTERMVLEKIETMSLEYLWCVDCGKPDEDCNCLEPNLALHFNVLQDILREQKLRGGAR